MKRKRDPLTLAPHWHLDCRLEAELPEDNLVGTRFLTHALFSALVLAALLFAGWLGYVNLSMHREISDWEQRLAENRAEVHDIQRLQREYAVEAAKIDEAFALVHPRFHVSGLLADLGRTRPESMTIDIVEWNDAGVVLRGSVHDTAEHATDLLGGYVKQLARDERIGPLFSDIRLSDLDRTGGGDLLKFEIHFTLRLDKA